jgi:radical SAM superfamily enzyme YgiQ (UPF0313 family)
VRRYKNFDIGVEGTIILGTDEQDEDYIRKLIDFLLEIELDLAEFTIMTPFAHTPLRAQLERQGRILTNRADRYTADKVVFQPARMSPQKLEDMYHYAWETFYRDEPQAYKMYKLYRKLYDKTSITE